MIHYNIYGSGSPLDMDSLLLVEHYVQSSSWDKPPGEKRTINHMVINGGWHLVEIEGEKGWHRLRVPYTGGIVNHIVTLTDSRRLDYNEVFEKLRRMTKNGFYEI